MTSTASKRVLVGSFIFSVCLLLTVDAFARAGGGGSAGTAVGGGILAGIIAIIFLPFYIAWTLLRKAKRKVEDTIHEHQLHKAAEHDPMWDEDAIKARVEKVYFTVQRAWMDRDQEIARDLITQRLYDKHKLQTDIMLEQHEKNMLQSINLLEVRVVRVDDQAEDTKDKLWTQIRGSMIDYTINEKTGHITGSTSEKNEFTEVWKFVRGPKGWLLDEIDQNVGLF